MAEKREVEIGCFTSGLLLIFVLTITAVLTRIADELSDIGDKM